MRTFALPIAFAGLPVVFFSCGLFLRNRIGRSMPPFVGNLLISFFTCLSCFELCRFQHSSKLSFHFVAQKPTSTPSLRGFLRVFVVLMDASNSWTFSVENRGLISRSYVIKQGKDGVVGKPSPCPAFGLPTRSRAISGAGNELLSGSLPCMFV
jgi:hypothetical protein